MSKLGRYSADRKKIEAISAAKTITQADCGTIFTITPGTSNYDITLPTVATAGRGWWCKFIQAASGTAQVKIIQNTSDSSDLVITNVLQTGIVGGVTGSGARDVPDGLGGFNFTSDGIKIRSGSAAAIGDQIEILTDATNWYAVGIVSGSTGNNLEYALAPYHA